MRSTLSTTLLIGAIFFSAVVNAASDLDPKAFPFLLRAWHNPRDRSFPLIHHYVDVDTAGNAVINQTADYRGSKNVCHSRIFSWFYYYSSSTYLLFCIFTYLNFSI